MDESLQRIPFIFLTALTERQNFRQGMELGADDFLTKPFTHKELTSAIKTQLEKHNTKENYLRIKIEEIENKLTQKLEEVEASYENQKKNYTEIEAKNEKLDNLLKEKELEMTEEALRAIEINNTIQNIKKMVEDALRNPDRTTHQSTLFLQLKRKINEKKFLTNNWTVFQVRFNQIYPHYISHFTKKFKNLTQYDLVFISAMRMGLSTTQLADLLNITEDSVRKSRYRLKKKIGLKKEDDFLKFIHSMDK